jgi:hypothetical protein
MTRLAVAVATGMVLAASMLPTNVVAQDAATTVETRIGRLEFTHDFANGYPTMETVEKLFDEMDFQRATQAYLWSLPVVAFAQWQYEQENALGAKSGDIVLYHMYCSPF